MFWFDKAHDHVLYVDKRAAAKGHISLRPNHEVKPDEIVDFRSMPYDDQSFKMVVFDPPHILARKSDGIMAKRYGSLDRETWRDDLRAGFTECWRVLETFGVLIFKWSSAEVPLKEVLECFPKRPLFGHPTNSKASTHWLCFMKLPE
jgi:hypothetical protein